MTNMKQFKCIFKRICRWCKQAIMRAGRLRVVCLTSGLTAPFFFPRCMQMAAHLFVSQHTRGNLNKSTKVTLTDLIFFQVICFPSFWLSRYTIHSVTFGRGRQCRGQNINHWTRCVHLNGAFDPPWIVFFSQVKLHLSDLRLNLRDDCDYWGTNSS